MILPREAEAIQRVVAETFGDPVGVRDSEALREALARPFATRQGIPSYPTYFGKVGALFQALVERKPFAGANRRTALVIAALLLEERGYRLKPNPGRLKAVLTGMELGFTSPHRVSAWIKENTVRERPVRGGASHRDRA
ncbi:MAG TPA: Fic family protein [Limnochordia bacterium]|nr:Fic family protein [Limnochordia bacterium]